jgi:transposase
MVVGVDAHKRTYTLVAIDDAGCKSTEKTVAATPNGHLDAVASARRRPELRLCA